MLSITEKIHNYIELLSSEGLIKFYDRNFQINISNSNLDNLFYKNRLLYLIVNDYDEFKSRLVLQKDMAYNDLMNFNPLNHESKAISFYKMYKDLKYAGTEEVIEKFNSIGLRRPFLIHFTEFEKIEGWIFSVIKKGVFVPMLSVLIILDNAYDERIAKEIIENFIDPDFKQYDGRENVSEVEIGIRNMLRRRKNQSSIQRPKKIEDLLFGNILDKVEQFNKKLGAEIDFLEPIFDVLNFRHSGNLRKLLMELINPVAKLIGRPKTLDLFKPFFYILFENNLDGLLTEDAFELENQNNIEFNGSYRGNYNSYYSTRVKTLAGI